MVIMRKVLLNQQKNLIEELGIIELFGSVW